MIWIQWTNIKILILGTKYCQYSQNRELSEHFLVIYQIKRSYVDLITNLKVWKRYLRDVLVLLIFVPIHGALIAFLIALQW